ncbi:unnamed protein product, partial [marine sediment metagenome]
MSLALVQPPTSAMIASAPIPNTKLLALVIVYSLSQWSPLS